MPEEKVPCAFCKKPAPKDPTKVGLSAKSVPLCPPCAGWIGAELKKAEPERKALETRLRQMRREVES